MASRPTLEVTITEDGKTHTAPVPFAVIGGDVLVETIRLVGIGKVTRLGAVNLRYKFAGELVTAVIPVTSGCRSSALAPVVSLVNIMVVWDGDTGDVADRFPECHAVKEPLIEIVLVDILSINPGWGALTRR